MSDTSFDATLWKWNFRPITEDGRIKTDGVPQELQQPAESQPGEELREIAKQLHEAGVRL